MTTVERLAKLIRGWKSDGWNYAPVDNWNAKGIAEMLVANGVTVQGIEDRVSEYNLGYAQGYSDCEAQQRWHPASEPPKEPGQYCLLILNREVNRKTGEIEHGVAPVHDEFWDTHSNIYGQLSDGRWFERTQRVWDGCSWGGYCEKVIAWTDMPQPPKGVG